MWELDITEVRLTRRQVVAAGGTAALIAILAALMPGAAEAAPKDAKRKLAELTGSAPLNEGKIAIDVPPYTQYGKQVRIAVSVDSPMSAGDRVKALHVLAERNTVPEVASYNFGALAGQARISTRIRVARTQILIVAAEMSDGTFHVGKARCKVARGGGGCG
jgi:sulfur-oxidizing protein SoxY